MGDNKGFGFFTKVISFIIKILFLITLGMVILTVLRAHLPAAYNGWKNGIWCNLVYKDNESARANLDCPRGPNTILEVYFKTATTTPTDNRVVVNYRDPVSFESSSPPTLQIKHTGDNGTETPISATAIDMTSADDSDYTIEFGFNLTSLTSGAGTLTIVTDQEISSVVDFYDTDTSVKVKITEAMIYDAGATPDADGNYPNNGTKTVTVSSSSSS